MSDEPVRLLLVDDHEVLRLGLRTLFDSVGGFQVVGEAGTWPRALPRRAHNDLTWPSSTSACQMGAGWRRAGRSALSGQKPASSS
jgi:hypothetical protein